MERFIKSALCPICGSLMTVYARDIDGYEETRSFCWCGFSEGYEEENDEETEAYELAAVIRESVTWDDCREEIWCLCEMAGLERELDSAEGENYEAVVYKSAQVLGVEI